MSKRCGLSFDCGAMMQQPGLNPEDCPNYRMCGSAGSEPDEEFEFIWGENHEMIRLTCSEVAIGC